MFVYHIFGCYWCNILPLLMLCNKLHVFQGQALLFTHDGNSSELLFKRLPEVDVESSQWTDALSTDSISLIYQNLQELDNFLSSQVSNSPFVQQ